ncbi:hypothetical protein, partial [Streptomyces rubiginosohelvolus]
GVIVKAAVAGVLGLLAQLFSIFLSVRDGRGLGEDLQVVEAADVAVLAAHDGECGPARAAGRRIAGLP